MTDPTPTFEPERARRAVRQGLWTVGLTVLAAAAAIVAAAQHPLAAQALTDLRGRAQASSLVAATALMSFAFVIMSLRWRALMPATNKPPVLGLTSIILAGLLLNYAVPGPFGELAAAWFAHRRYGLPLADAMASGVGARLIGLASAALMAALIGLFAPLPIDPRLNEAVLIGAAAVGAGGLMLLALAARPAPIIRAVDRAVSAADGPGPLRTIVRRGLGAVRALAEASHRVALGGPARLLPALGWSTLGHFTVIAGILIALDGLDATPSPVGVAFTYAITTASSVLLFALPGSQFGWDALFATLLSQAGGASEVDALATAGLVRAQQLLYMVIGAIAVAGLLRQTLGPSPGRPAGPAPDPAMEHKPGAPR
jgi:hypothetical protein